ncbi:MAG: hypothetical protein K0S55_800 [Clostridia bacterium]|nr:hypothetical protein [Clostridia bacterium]
MKNEVYQICKRNNFLRNTYERASYYKKLINKSYRYYIRNRKKVITEDYIKRIGAIPDLSNPKTFNEKINWLKLNWHDTLAVDCADKFAVRQVVKERYGESILNTLYGVYENPNEIDFDKLPEQFILKVNNGCGNHIICKDKKLLDIKKVKSILINGIKDKYHIYNNEWCYEGIKPNINCEKLLDENGLSPNDYKFFCNYGEPKFLYVASERQTGVKFDFFDMSFNHIPVKQHYDMSAFKISKPFNFDEMVKVARKLSKGFPFVRVDLYNINGKIIFGEYTFFHMSGGEKFEPEIYDEIFGNMIDISPLKTISNLRK